LGKYIIMFGLMAATASLILSLNSGRLAGNGSTIDILLRHSWSSHTLAFTQTTGYDRVSHIACSSAISLCMLEQSLSIICVAFIVFFILRQPCDGSRSTKKDGIKNVTCMLNFLATVFFLIQSLRDNAHGFNVSYFCYATPRMSSFISILFGWSEFDTHLSWTFNGTHKFISEARYT
ncbi:hypothetical protein L9F63_024043, partial [Diploptera punctata]